MRSASVLEACVVAELDLPEAGAVRKRDQVALVEVDQRRVLALREPVVGVLDAANETRDRRQIEAHVATLRLGERKPVDRLEHREPAAGP